MNSKTKQNQNYRSDNFLEAFRELGKQTANTAKDAVTGVASDVANQLSGKSPNQPSGEFNQNQSFNFEQQLLNREKESLKKARIHHEQIRRQEKLVFSRKEEQIKAQISAIQEELKKLIKEAVGLAQEVEVAVEQSIVNPGIYHLTFFDKLRQLLILLRKKVHDSRTWMHQVNARSASRKGYWGKVKQSGTKFMLSQERYMSTQAG